MFRINKNTFYFIYREEKESAKQILCEQCLLDDTKTEATRFCRSCQDPEPMCEICAKQHIRQKDSRDHEICQDLQMMSKKTYVFSNNLVQVFDMHFDFFK